MGIFWLKDTVKENEKPNMGNMGKSYVQLVIQIQQWKEGDNLMNRISIRVDKYLNQFLFYVSSSQLRLEYR